MVLGSPGAGESTDENSDVANVRRNIILQYVRQGRLTPVMREKLLTLTTQQALTDYAQQQDAAYLESLPIDGNLAMDVLNNVVGIGPRFSGSEGMLQQQKMLEAIFEEHGGVVEYQRFKAKNPISQQGVEVVDIANMIVRWFPER